MRPLGNMVSLLKKRESVRGLCQLRGRQSGRNPGLPAVTVTGARQGSLWGLSAEAPAATCAPGACSVLCPGETVHGSTISG